MTLSPAILNLVVSLGVGIFSFAGIAALWRAIGQNRTDIRNSLASEQDQFRKDLMARVALVETQKAALVTQIAVMTAAITTLTVERDKLKDRIDDLERDIHRLQGAPVTR